MTVIIILCLSVGVTGQELLDMKESCSYYGNPVDVDLYGFESDAEAEEAVNRIMKYTGLKPNFVIMAANVANAAAAIHGTQRYLLYNQDFMLRIKDMTQTDWAALSIMAHEIGHHLNGHTLVPGGSRPKTELEADLYSGFILYKMGATREEAQIVMQNIASEQGSASHPPKSARLAAITNGWIQAREQEPSPNSDPTVQPSAPVPTLPPTAIPQAPTVSSPTPVPQRETGVNLLPFSDAVIKTLLLEQREPKAVEDAFFYIAKQTYPHFRYYDMERTGDNDLSHNQLSYIIFNPDIKEEEKIDQVINEVLEPKDIDILFSGQYIYDGNKLQIRLFIVDRIERKIRSRIVVFEKEEDILCGEPQSSSIAFICPTAQEIMRLLVTELFE